MAALAAVERARILTEARGRHAADVAKDAELTAVEGEKILADGADLELRLQVGFVFVDFHVVMLIMLL